MNEEEKEAIEEAKKQIEEAHNLNELNVFMTDSTTLKILLNYIDKLQKVINLMAEDRAELSEDSIVPTCKEAIINYYFKMMEEENETN